MKRNIIGLLVVVVVATGATVMLVQNINSISSSNNGLAQVASALPASPVPYSRPHITSISPASGAMGSSVTIYGSNFDPGNNLIYFIFGDTLAAYVSLPSTANGTQIGPLTFPSGFNLPSAPGTEGGPQASWNIEVETPTVFNGNLVYSNSNVMPFYISPTITSVSISTSTNVFTINGTGFYKNVIVYLVNSITGQLPVNGWFDEASSLNNGTQVKLTIPLPSSFSGVGLEVINYPSGYGSSVFSLPSSTNPATPPAPILSAFCTTSGAPQISVSWSSAGQGSEGYHVNIAPGVTTALFPQGGWYEDIPTGVTATTIANLAGFIHFGSVSTSTALIQNQTYSVGIYYDASTIHTVATVLVPACTSQ